MSNQYFEFSFCLNAEPESALYLSELCRIGKEIADDVFDPASENQEGLDIADVVRKLMQTTGENGYGVEAKFIDDGVMLFSTNNGFDVGYVAGMLQHYLQKIDNPAPIAFQWSMHDDRGKPDCFGGGAVFVTRDEIKFMDTNTWVQQQLASFDADSRVEFNPMKS